MSRWAWWVTAGVWGAALGLTCAWLTDSDRYPAAMSVVGMATLAAWFIVSDMWLDNVYLKDAERAKLAPQVWDSYET